MSRLTELVCKVLRIHAGDNPIKVKENICVSSLYQVKEEKIQGKAEIVATIPKSQKNKDTPNRTML